jgi:hypothetical protein
MTREQLAAALADHIGAPAVRSLIVSSGWGSPLKPLAFRGDLCFGPSQGQTVTFVRPSAWIGTWQPAEPQAALQEIARRYLWAYGPATPEDFARWWAGGGLIAAKKLFKSLADELEAVDVAGWRAFALRTTLEPMQRSGIANTVRLLALFDPYVLGIGGDIEPLLAKVYKHKVYRPQGWISAVVLVDGYIKGVWEYTARRSQTIVKVQLFAAPTASVRRGIEAEAQRLRAFLNTDVVLEYAD